jgi:hypothetical protein
MTSRTDRTDQRERTTGDEAKASEYEPSAQDESSDVADDADGVSVVGARPKRPVGPSARERARRAGRDRRADAEPEVAEASDEGIDTGAGGGLTGPWAKRGERHVVVLRPLVAVVLGLVTILGVVLSIAFGLAWGNLNSQNDQRTAAAQAATTFLKDLTNFKPATVDADFAALQNWAANGSEFAKQAAQTFNSNIRHALIQAQASSQGQIRSIFVETLDPPHASAYAVVDQAYQNSKMTSPATDTLRLDVGMTDTAKGWRIETVTVENPSGTPSAPSSSAPTTPSG